MPPTMSAYYNEIDPFSAQWLRNLICAGHIATGEVDERSITDVSPDDLVGFTQCHFFAGIGVWSYALRLAGWPDDRPVWTGSCPCQPFSVAGKRAGTSDSRHLWPDLLRLVRERNPAVIFGEQVASPDGLLWLDSVQTDMESAGYAIGSADLCAAGVGAPHIRQRLFWVGHSSIKGLERHPWDESQAPRREEENRSTTSPSVFSGMGNPNGDGRESRNKTTEATRYRDSADSNDRAYRKRVPGTIHEFWRSTDWIRCRNDGNSEKWRPVEPGTFPVADGNSSSMGKIRAYGNAIVPQVASEFIKAYMECRP